MNAVVFPGQGAQYAGMGKTLYDNFSQARDMFQAVDQAAGFSLSRMCFEGPEQDLKNTRIQQLAILAVSLACYQCLPVKTKESIAFFSGLSLGEYPCLYCAGVLALEDVVALVKERAEAMEEAAALNPSTMFAVLGKGEGKLPDLQSLGFYVANMNCPGQTVVSLAKENKEAVRTGLVSAGFKVIELKVSGGFHSPFMEPARKRLEKMIDGIEFKDADIPIVSNVTAKGHLSSAEIRENLLNQLISPVLWQECVEFMIGQGVGRFLETGPKQVLKGLIKKISRSVAVTNFEKYDDYQDNGL